jgi:hypothetical protein
MYPIRMTGFCRNHHLISSVNPLSKHHPFLYSPQNNTPTMSSQSSTVDLTFSSSPFDTQSSGVEVEGSDPPSSSPPAPTSSPPAASPSSPPSRLDGPDYGSWNPAWWARFPGYGFSHSLGKQRSWWWLHGFRLKQQTGDQLPNPRTLWVCELCVAKRPPPPRTKYLFVASTGRSIESHLRTHNISNRSSSLRNTRLDGRG